MSQEIAIKLALQGVGAVQTGLKSVESGLGRLGGSLKTVAASAGGLAASLGLGVSVGKLVQVQREFDVLNSSLKTVTGSSAAAEREMAWLKQFAKETPFGLAQATQGFVKMKALGLEPTRGALTSFGNTASAMGKDLNQMIEAVADASTGEFERLKEFGIKAKKEGDNVSLTFQGVTTTIKNSSSEITKYLEDIGNVQFVGAMAERAKTLDGAISELGDTWDELFRTINERNAGTLIYDSVKLANGAIEDATTIIKAMTAAYDENGQATGAMATIQNGIATVFETVTVLGANLKYVLVQIGTEIGGLAAQVAQAAQFNFSGVAAIREQMVADAEEARRQIDATTARILGARKAQEEYARWSTRNASAATDPRRIDLGRPAASGKPTGPTDADIKAANKALQDQAKLLAELSGLSGSFAADWQLLTTAYKSGKLSLDGLTAAQAALLEKQPAVKAAADEEKKAQDLLNKAYQEASAERLKLMQSMEQQAASAQDQNRAMRDEIELIGLTEEQQLRVLQQRGEAIILTKEATLAELERASAITGTMTREQIALQAEIEALRERNGLLGARYQKTEVAKAAQDAAGEWTKLTDSVYNGLSDSLYRGFEAGKGFAKTFWDGLKNTAKTFVLKIGVQGIMTGVSGLLGLGSSAAAAATGGAAAVGGAGNLLTAASLAGNSSFMMGLSGAWGAGGGLMSTLNAGASLLQTGTLSSITSGLGTIAGALGPIALGVGAVVSLIKKLDDSGTMHTGALSQYSAAGGLASSTTHGAFGMGFGGVDYSAETEKFTGAMAQSIVQMLDSTATTFGKEAGYKAATAFADDTSKDGAWGGLLISKLEETIVNWDPARTSKWAPKEFADGAAGKEQYLAAVAADVRVALDSIGLPAWATGMLDKLGQGASIEQLAGAVDQINAAKAAFASFGQYMPTFAGLADTAISKLVDASGGVGALAGNMSAFVDGFYTDAEKLAINTQNVRDALAKLGFEMPATREEFKALVQSQIALGDAGAQTTAGLLAVSGAVSAVLPPFEAAAAGVDAAINTVSDAMRRLQSDTASLEVQLLRAKGDTAGADAGQRAIDTAGLTAAEVAVYDYNQSLRAQIAALDAAAAAADAAAAEVARQADIRAGFERQLLELQGNTAALRLLDIAGMDATNMALYDQVQALTAAKAAAQAAEQAEQTLAAQREQVAQQRYGLEGQLLQLQGDTVALRARELAALDPANRALQEQIWSLTDLQAAAQAAERAEQDLAATRSRVAQERYGLEGQLLQLQGDTVALRARELAALDPANRALQEQIWSLTDLQAAAQAAERAEQDLAATRSRVAQERYGLETQLLQLQGNTAALQQRELELLDPSNRALQEQVWALQAQTQAAQAAASASQQLRSAWQSVTDSIFDEVQRIRGITAQDAGLGYAAAQAQFGIATAQARAGDQAAAQSLPGLSQALLTLAEANATSLIELQRIRAQTAGSLMQTGAGIGRNWGIAVPQFDVGTNYVPRDMLAVVHKGEKIIPDGFDPAAFVADMGLGMGGPSSAQIVSAIAALQGQVARLEQVLARIDTSAASTSRATATTAAVLDDASRGRRPLETKVTTP